MIIRERPSSKRAWHVLHGNTPAGPRLAIKNIIRYNAQLCAQVRPLGFEKVGINELEELAYSCRVSLNAACKQAGMATSTPYRWKHGSRPSAGQAERLENAILQVAVNRGTLPSELESRIPSGIVKQSDDAKTIARHLRHIADQVEALAK